MKKVEINRSDLIAFLISFTLLIIVLGGYFIYDVFIKDNDTVDDKELISLKVNS